LVADITYIRLKAEFVYLAVILDAFSRKVVGWALDRTLANRLTISALERAIGQRRPRPGLVHHSDRGLQYARGEYVAALEKFGIVASIGRPANPYDNASCERFAWAKLQIKSADQRIDRPERYPELSLATSSKARL
jgi:putative transposase